MDVVKTQVDKLKRDLDKIAVLNQIEEKTGAPKEYIVLGGVVLGLILLFFGIGAGVLCNMVGFLYPAYRSFQAIETKNTEDDTQWLVYWVVYSLFSVMEVFIDAILFWIPFYFAFKFAFLVWLMAPASVVPGGPGARWLYDNFLADFLRKHESAIDASIEKISSSSGQLASEALGAASEVASAAGGAAMSAVNNARSNASKYDDGEKKDL